MHPPLDRLLGAVIGLAVGDAARPPRDPAAGRPGEPPADPFLTPPDGFSPFDRRPGVWSAGTGMALCLGTSLVETRRFDPADQLDRYVRWWREGYLTATGRCLAIGATTRQALRRFADQGDPVPGNPDPRTAGSGSLLRLAPVVVWANRRPDQALALARESSLTTHAAPECVDACEYLAGLLILSWAGADLGQPLRNPSARWSPAIRAIAQADYRSLGPAPWMVSNYVVDTLAAARRVLAQSRTFREAIEMATRLGGESHPVAAVVGQVAGARWGLSGIPRKWVARLVRVQEIMALAGRLAEEGPRWRDTLVRRRPAWSQASPSP